jgi:FtsZ-binding cell division protein ZapB
LSIEFLTDLEKKVDALIQNITQLRQENSQLKGELEKKAGSISDSENENRVLKDELSSLKATSQEQHDKLSVAVEKIQGLIAKIESV